MLVKLQQYNMNIYIFYYLIHCGSRDNTMIIIVSLENISVVDVTLLCTQSSWDNTMVTFIAV